jgi:hypothetical protein
VTTFRFLLRLLRVIGDKNKEEASGNVDSRSVVVRLEVRLCNMEDQNLGAAVESRCGSRASR